ncbi:MAG: hypothetical protein K0R44_384 [Thermomicrobiales bacterium]|nr:hypothetical protein [Thermomicrobiales bacterium]
MALSETCSSAVVGRGGWDQVMRTPIPVFPAETADLPVGDGQA